MINIQIQGCQIYPKDRSRGRDSFELQRTGHSHQGGEVMGLMSHHLRSLNYDLDHDQFVFLTVCPQIPSWQEDI